MQGLQGLRSWAEIFRVQVRTELAINLQYRASTAIWLIGAVLEPIIYLTVWTTVTRAQGGAVGGFTAGDFAAYYIVGLVIQQLIFTWIMWEYEYFIRDGSFAVHLLRPIHPIFHDIAVNISYKAITLVILVPVVLILSLIFKPVFNLQGWAVVAFAPALVLAFALRFTFDWTLAMAAFWTTRISAINGLYNVTFIFMSGRFAPLSLFPPLLGALAYMLPFRWMLSFPLELFLGLLTPRDALEGFAWQMGWLVVAFVLMRLVWRRAVRKFSAVGT